MNKSIIAILAAASAILAACNQNDTAWTDNAIDTAVAQLKLASAQAEGTGKLPKSLYSGYDLDFLSWQLDRDAATFKDSLRALAPAEKMGTVKLCWVYDWTSGFFPGSLWYAYELTGDEKLKEEAVKYTNLLNPVRYYDKTHDLGFMMGCSYGNAWRLTQNDTIPAVIVETADNLISRFDPKIGTIRSWDFGPWNWPVIIDNMMNLELLFLATELSGDSKYRDIALTHANTTMKNHFREDYTSWHVVSYNDDGSVQCKQTFQGRNDDSAWARGQAWGVYGYTLCYRETKDKKYLDFARHIADMIMSRVKTEDGIPYWDYTAPASDKTPRDASSAAVTASALFELCGYVEDGQKYYDYAEKLLKSLSSTAYLAGKGQNGGFILMHSTGSLPHGSEIDVPLNYADYYYLEALKRYLKK